MNDCFEFVMLYYDDNDRMIAMMIDLLQNWFGLLYIWKLNE